MFWDNKFQYSDYPGKKFFHERLRTGSCFLSSDINGGKEKGSEGGGFRRVMSAN